MPYLTSKTECYEVKTALQTFAERLKYSNKNRNYSFNELPRIIKSAFRTFTSGRYSASPDNIR